MAVDPRALEDSCDTCEIEGCLLTFVKIEESEVVLDRPEGCGVLTALEPWPSAAKVMETYNGFGGAVAFSSESKLATSEEGAEASTMPVRTAAGLANSPRRRVTT